MKRKAWTPLQREIRGCRDCDLRKGCKRPVPGYAPGKHQLITFVGESPGYHEDRSGRPFAGSTGKETDGYLSRVNLTRDIGFMTNVVKCRPPGNREPSQDQIDTCSQWLIQEMFEYDTPYVATLGDIAAKALLGSDFDLETYHGIPRPWHDKILIPMYHPALGMHNARQMTQIAYDFEVLSRIVKGKDWTQFVPVDDIGDDLEYVWLEDGDFFPELGFEVAIDTEWADGPWCLSFSCHPGQAFVVKADQTEAIRKLAKHVANPDVTTIMHNAMYDLSVLESMGVVPAKVADTMVAAYLLQDLPQGLKALAYRVGGMEMRDYSDVVAPATQVKCMEYLHRVLEYEWPTPEPVLEWKSQKQDWHVRQPQSVEQRTRRILSDWENGKEVDFYDRWTNIEESSRQYISLVLGGPMQRGNLADIYEEDPDTVLNYAARDADATFRLWPYLRKRLHDTDLMGVFDMDISTIPVVNDMQTTGMRVDPIYFANLSEEFRDNMFDLNDKIDDMIGYHINPGSPPQLRQLLFKKLKLPACKFSKITGEESADNEVLRSLISNHPVVREIIEWKHLQKMKTAFADTLPAKADEDNRVHPNIRITRVVTGRISCSDPNLMAIPVRDEEALKIRMGFVAKPGCKLVSADYSGIEMRVVAHEADEEQMIQMFINGEDIHTQTASRIFGIPPDRVDKVKHRYPSKRVGFGVLNQITPEGLSDLLILEGCGDEWAPDRTAELIKEWFNMYAAIKRCFAYKKAEARRLGYVRDMWGRIRLVPEMKSVLPWVVDAGERQCCSAFVQAGAQGIMKKAMIKLTPMYEEYLDKGHWVHPLIQIHDDLVWEVEDEIVDEFCEAKKYIMENVVQLKMPLEVELKVGERWGEME